MHSLLLILAKILSVLNERFWNLNVYENFLCCHISFLCSINLLNIIQEFLKHLYVYEIAYKIILMLM